MPRPVPLVLPFLLAPLALPAWAGDVRLDLPLGGWRNSQGENIQYTQPVSYPAVAVSAPPGQSRAGLIAGHLAQAPKPDSKPATLVVNGVAMPQRIEADGRFSRPYSFGAGGNSVELRAPDGGVRRVQFHEGHGGRGQSRLKVVLSWDSDATDLDLHVLTPDGNHVFYGNRVLDNGAALDVDVTTGYGPEIVSMPVPLPGPYYVFVNYYGAGSQLEDLTVAQVTLISNENTPAEKKQTFTVPLRNPGELTQVAAFNWP